jgi:hypothetical protein
MLIAGLAIALLIGIVSAATISYFGQVKMTASVSQAVLVDGKIYPAITEQTADVAGGGSFMRCHWLQSQTSVPVTVLFETAYDPALWDNEITTTVLEIFDEAYPASYTPPTTWDLLVTTLADLQSAVKNSANTGKVIAVQSGDYSGGVIDITVANIKLLSKDGPATTTLKGVKISASGVTVSGFTIKSSATLYSADKPCVYLTKTLSDIEISYNELTRDESGRSIGIISESGATYTNVRIVHNKIHGLTTGVYTNPLTGVIYINHNEIYNNEAGVGGATGATIEYNTFHDNYNSWSHWNEAIGADDTATSLTIQYNNFLGDDSVAMYGTKSIDALNNWWDCDGIDTHGNVVASYLVKSDFTLQPGETDWFAICYKFAVDIYPYIYTITTTVKPAP